MKEKTPLLHYFMCFKMPNKRLQLKVVLFEREITSFLKTYTFLQRKSFLTMFCTINSSPMHHVSSSLPTKSTVRLPVMLISHMTHIKIRHHHQEAIMTEQVSRHGMCTQAARLSHRSVVFQPCVTNPLKKREKERKR